MYVKGEAIEGLPISKEHASNNFEALALHFKALSISLLLGNKSDKPSCEILVFKSIFRVLSRLSLLAGCL